MAQRYRNERKMRLKLTKILKCLPLKKRKRNPYSQRMTAQKRNESIEISSDSDESPAKEPSSEEPSTDSQKD